MAKTQADAVVEVMEQNGGFATLGYLYQHTLNVPEVEWKTKTPFASMRRIVQMDGRIFKIKPGLWALESHKEELPFPLEDAPEKLDKNEQNTFNHSYFQGLLVEIGNFKRLSTYVPPQDKNQLFLQRPLDEVTTVKKILPFAYDELLRRARTVDVVWFNERQMPHSFIEVEHSTDINNSLGKFVDLQDFHADFTIVAPEARKREFDAKLDSTKHNTMKKRVNFWGYEKVSKIHSNLAELVAQDYFA